MTTAHRPTWNPAQASKDQGGNRFIAPTKQYSSRDLPGHTKLKYRQEGQNTEEEIKQRNLKDELLRKEAEAIRKRKRHTSEEDEEEDDEYSNNNNNNNRSHLEDDFVLKKPKLLAIDFNLDKDDSGDEHSGDEDEDGDDKEDDNEDDSSSSDDDSDDSEDEEEELRRELEKIKQERAAAALKKAKEEEEEQSKEKESKVLYENPLLAPRSEDDFSLKKKWYDDVIFKNQARDEPKVEKRFINDTIRNDFHRKFLNKYVK